MIDQKRLEEVCTGLEEMISRYKRNLNPGDKDRLNTTKKGLEALRKVILMMEIKGDIQDISPIKSGKKVGWMVVDSDNKSKNYCV